MLVGVSACLRVYAPPKSRYRYARKADEIVTLLDETPDNAV